VRARPIAVVVMLITFAWISLPFFVTVDAAHRQDVQRNASLLERSDATATFVVGDRVTKARWLGAPIAFGALAIGTFAFVSLHLGVACTRGLGLPRPTQRRSAVERGPPAF
jgi:hypothetical protein